MKTYKISELGKKFHLSRSTLLYYDRIGLLPASIRTETAYRLYSEEDMDKLERICFFREMGLSLSEIATLLEKDNSNTSILEKRLKAIGCEMMKLKSQQRLITGLLQTVSGEFDTSGLDKELWLNLQKACGLDEKAIKKWHAEFERKAPEAHHEFLLGLGLSEKEAIQVRMLTKDMEDNAMKMKYFYEIFVPLPRQGPGCTEATLKALSLLKNLPSKAKVLDIGCGAGTPTVLLAKELKTKILAIDNHQPMLDRLNRKITQSGLEIKTKEMSMIDMPFDKESFDVLWAEGTISIMGLEKGLKDFRTYLKPGGYLAFTEMCWFTENPPEELKTYLDNWYPDIKTAYEVSKLILVNRYKIIENFNLPDSAWWDDFYTPMLERIKKLRAKNAGIPEAEAIYSERDKEVDMFRKYSNHYGYVFFVVQTV